MPVIHQYGVATYKYLLLFLRFFKKNDFSFDLSEKITILHTQPLGVYPF